MIIVVKWEENKKRNVTIVYIPIAYITFFEQGISIKFTQFLRIEIVYIYCFPFYAKLRRKYYQYHRPRDDSIFLKTLKTRVTPD